MRRALLGMTVGTLVLTLAPVTAATPPSRAAAALSPAAVAALDRAEALVARRASAATDTSRAHWLRAERANLGTARAVLATIDAHADPFDRGVALAAQATEHQARELGEPTRHVAPTRHASPSAAAAALAARYGVVPDAKQRAALRDLDRRAQPLRQALTDVLDRFLVFDATTRAVIADGTVGRAAAVLTARGELLAAVARLRSAGGPAKDDSAAPVVLCPALAIDFEAIDSVYTADCALLIDAGGHDTYYNNAGGAGLTDNPLLCAGGLPAAALVDLAGNDAYRGPGCGVNGGAIIGAGFLLDASGDDSYFNGSYGGGANGGARGGAGFLLDAGGDDRLGSRGPGINGGANGGSGLLVNVGGNDIYVGEMGSNGGAVGSASGVLIDTAGDDLYSAIGVGSNGGAYNARGLLLDATGRDTYYGANGRVDPVGAGLLFDAAGTGDSYKPIGSTVSYPDQTVVPAGIVGAQIDVPSVPPVELPSVEQAATFVSDGCDGGTNVLAGHLADTYVKVRTGADPADARTQWVCLATEAGGTHLGGRVEVRGIGGAPTAVDQDPGSVASCASKSNNVTVQNGTVAGQPYRVDVTPQPAGTTDSAWVCVRLTGSLGLRLRYTGALVPAVTAKFLADPSTAHVPSYPVGVWPVAGPSASCAGAGGTRYVNATIGTTPVALYGWQESLSRTHLCLRAGGAGGAGGRLTADADEGVGPLRTGHDLTPCPFAVFTREQQPTYGVYTSEPATLGSPPVSACVEVAGFELSVTAGGSNAANPSWTPDPA